MLAAIKAQKPDILLGGGYTGDMQVIARQTAEQGLNLKMLGFTLGPTLPGFIQALGSQAEYLLEPVQWTPNMGWKDEIFGWTSAELAEICLNETGHACDYHPPQSVAALEVYQRALQKAGSLDPQKVRDALAQTDIVTAYGPIRFNKKGQNIAKGMGVVQIQGGKPMVVYPREFKQAELVYPIPNR
jgi:branched-chain amino acid transport system substrate-binding protein